MRATYRVLTATAFLLLPAVLISSCDDKNSTPVGPSDDPTITDIEAPSFTTVGFGSAWHDPHIKGPKVRTFFEDLSCSGLEAKRFPSGDGAEISNKNVEVTDFVDPAQCIVGVYPVDQKIKGKLLGDVKELDFSYAGGDEGASPTMRVPIDECELEADVAVTPAPACTTDGVQEGYVYIDGQDCNDGDADVGVINTEDKETDCFVFYDDDIDDDDSQGYDTWNLFVTDHPDWRIARKQVDGSDARTAVIIDWFETSGEGHYLVWKIDVR